MFFNKTTIIILFKFEAYIFKWLALSPPPRDSTRPQPACSWWNGHNEIIIVITNHIVLSSILYTHSNILIYKIIQGKTLAPQSWVSESHFTSSYGLTMNCCIHSLQVNSQNTCTVSSAVGSSLSSIYSTVNWTGYASTNENFYCFSFT